MCIFTNVSASNSQTELTKQNERNKEIGREKIIADTKSLIQEIDFTKSDFTTLEDSITYFAMLKQFRNEHFG